MKNTLLALIVSLTFLVGRVYGQVTNLPIGSAEKVMAYSLATMDEIHLYVRQPKPEKPNYSYGVYVAGQKDLPRFSSKKELDTYFADKLQKTASQMVTVDRGQNKNLPFTIWGIMVKYFPDTDQQITYFEANSTFTLVRSSDGQYHLPDLSGVKLELLPNVPIRIKDLRWVREETTDEDGNVLEVSDTQVDPAGLIGVEREMLIPTSHAISGTNGPTRTTIRMLSGPTNAMVYQAFGPMGQLLVEPATVKLSRIEEEAAGSKGRAKGLHLSNTMLLEVQCRATGRVLQLQETENGIDWFDTQDAKFSVSDQPMFIYQETNAGMKLYRLRSVSELPEYVK